MNAPPDRQKRSVTRKNIGVELQMPRHVLPMQQILALLLFTFAEPFICFARVRLPLPHVICLVHADRHFKTFTQHLSND